MQGMTPREADLAGTDGGMHARLAQSLIEAANYIAAHPDLPIPDRVDIHYCIPAPDDKAGEDETYRIAAILGAPVTGDDGSETELSFGPVSYRAVYINRDEVAAYQAHMAPYYATLRTKQEGLAA